MDWNELIIKTTHEAKEAVANILNEYGANGVVVEEAIKPDDRYGFQFGELYELTDKKFSQEGVTIKAYFLNDQKWQSLHVEIVRAIEQLQQFEIDIGDLTITVAQVKESDWENEWKKYFKPFRVTERFTIVPTWETYAANLEDDQLMILMDPGMAFGTGTHATTKLSLLALEKTIEPNDTVIDVGSGSGILSIAAKLLNAKHVFSYDLDQVAVNSTINNRDLNHFTDSITVQQNDLLKDVTHEEKVDVVVANILAHIILLMIEDAFAQLKDNGYFIVSGIIEKEAKNIESALQERGFSIEEILMEDNWYTFIARKSSK